MAPIPTNSGRRRGAIASASGRKITAGDLIPTAATSIAPAASSGPSRPSPDAGASRSPPVDGSPRSARPDQQVDGAEHQQHHDEVVVLAAEAPHDHDRVQADERHRELRRAAEQPRQAPHQRQQPGAAQALTIFSAHSDRATPRGTSA